MDTNEDITVTLPYWKLIYFLGWLDAQKPPPGNNILESVIAEMASGLIP